MKNQDLIESLKKGHEELVNLAAKFPHDKREEILFDQWSLKDILAHFSAWDKLDTYHTECVRDGKDFEWVYDEDTFNAEEVAKRKHLTWEGTLEEFDNAGKHMIEVFQSLPDDAWDRSCGPQEEHSPTTFLKSHVEHYWDSHIPPIKEILEKKIS